MSSVSQAVAPIKPTGILDLPCELLETIFSFLLVSEEPIDGSRLHSELHRKISGQIVLTCKPMYNIGIHYIFRNNDLMFCGPSELHHFLHHSGIAAARSILLKIGDETSCSWYQYLDKGDELFSFTRDMANTNVNCLEIELGHKHPPFQIDDTAPGATSLDICTALVKQYRERATWTGKVPPLFVIRHRSGYADTLAYEMCTAVESAIYDDDLTPLTRYKEGLKRRFG